MEEEEGTIEGHIGRSVKDRLQMAVFPDGSEGKHAVTHYKVLQRFGYVTLISCRLETGRTHQIRAHMRYLGHPLFNDERYGGDKILKGTPSRSTSNSLRIVSKRVRDMLSMRRSLALCIQQRVN